MTDLLTKVESFCAEMDMSPSRFGREFMNDPGFVWRLRAGGECLPRTAQRLLSEMEGARGRASPEATVKGPKVKTEIHP